MEKGLKGIITYDNGKTSKVEVHEVISYPATGMSSDIIFKYNEEEKYRPLINPIGGGHFLLPNSLVEQVFIKD